MRKQGDPQTATDREAMAELLARLGALAADMERTYEPALARLLAAGEPGADATDEGIGDLAEALRWLGIDLGGMVFAAGDIDLHTYWHLCETASAEDVPLTDDGLIRLVAENARRPAEELNRFRRGQAKAAALAVARAGR